MKKVRMSFTTIISTILFCLLCVTACEPTFDGSSKHREFGTKGTMGLFRTALSKYKLDIGNYPEKLEYLWICPPNMEPGKWQGPYMDGLEETRDDWGHYFQCEVFDESQKCKITSAGQDGKFGTADDIYETYPHQYAASPKEQ